jgi:hypothetical protein
MLARPRLDAAPRCVWIAVASFLPLSLVGCQDEVDEPIDDSPCASFDHLTTTPTFAADVMPIFQQSCNFSSCHSSASPNPQAGLALGLPSGQGMSMGVIGAVHAGIVGVDASQANATLVVPGSPAQSFFVAKLHYQEEAMFRTCGFDCTDCGTIMPVGTAAGLDSARRDTIAAWVQRGALND